MATVIMDAVREAVDTPRGERILARQRATPVSEARIWRGLDNVSILDENPDLAVEPLMVRKALAVRRLLLAQPATIAPDELIVGTFRARLLSQPKVPDFITAEEKAQYGIDQDYGWYGHNTLDYAGLLAQGFSGVRAQARAALERLSKSDDSDAQRQIAFYRSIIVCCDTMRDFSQRYVDLAETLADRERDPQRVVELRQIARICRRVPEYPATSFHEALQSYAFYHVAIHSVYADGAMGRIDQYFYPFLKHDLENGVLTYAEAQELVDCFVLKINDCTRYWTGDNILMGRFHNVVLGGQTRDGRDAANEVSYMVLDALRRLSSNFPTVSVRLHKGSPDRLIRACCEVMRSNAGAPALYNDEIVVPALVDAGIPLEDARDFCNDGCWETTIAGKTQFTYVTFSAAKCLEWVLTRGRGLPLDWKRALGWKQGETYDPVPVSELSVSWPEDLEYSGRGMVTDGTRAVGQLTFGTPLDTGDPLGFDTFEALMAAMERQIDHQVRTEMKRYLDRYRTEAAKVAGARGPTPLASAFIQDCMARGKGYGEGGEQYTIAGVDVCAIGTTADSLAAIQKFVYEDRVLELGQLIDLLFNNFEGAEEVRSMLRTRAPKYGNGDPAADELAARLLNFIADRVAAHAQDPDMALPDGYRLVWGLLTGTFEWAPSHGAGLGASPDGRRASEPSSSNLAPSVGVAMHGPTAALRSYTGLPLQRLRSGAPLDLSMDGSTTAGEAGLARLMGFVRSFVDLGGNFMTITLVDGDTLRQAQQEPDRYRHLRVRLGGSQAYFVGLSRAMQDYYIARVEQGFN